MTTYVLGISAFYHDSAAALLADGAIVAAAQEERFTRIKHDPAFPAGAIGYCLREAGIALTAVDYVVFYDKPLITFERLLETYIAYAPKGLRSFLTAMPLWLKDKLFLKATLRKSLAQLGNVEQDSLPPLLFTAHHEAHAASAFYPSPFGEAAVLCLDGVGEWATTSVWLGKGNILQPIWQIDFPHSLGLLYSAFTYYVGFKVNSGEYKLMGLAPYGQPEYVDEIRDELIDLKADGTFRLNMRYFNFATGLTMTNSKFDRLFGGPPRQRESELTQRHMDIARSVQAVVEEIILRLANTLHSELAVDNLCLAGGVALNCVANGRLVRESPFKNIWIQPAAGDAGGALGAALRTWHTYLDAPRSGHFQDTMQGGYLGESFSNSQVTDYLDGIEAKYELIQDDELFSRTAQLLADGNVIGWFNGRMEFGPRALGGRSILADPRSLAMQSKLNQKIKFRESFRPFAPAVLAEKTSDWFNLKGESPYMLIVAAVAGSQLTAQAGDVASGFEQLEISRSTIPAVTHVDCSARIQTVERRSNPHFHRLISEFETITGCPMLINTSFNVRGEPIVRSPHDAYRCFMHTNMDYLVMGNVLLAKCDQPQQADNTTYLEQFELD